MPATRVFDHFHILLRKPSRFLERFPVLCFPTWRDYLPIIGIYYYIYSKWEKIFRGQPCGLQPDPVRNLEGEWGGGGHPYQPQPNSMRRSMIKLMVKTIVAAQYIYIYI